MSILFVEDHVDTREVVVKLLGMKGYHVTAAGTAGEAKQFCKGDAHFDVLISDIVLPDGTGHEVLKCCRGSCGYSIAFTGQAMPKEIRATMDAGFDEVLVKPIGFHALTASLERVWGAREGAD